MDINRKNKLLYFQKREMYIVDCFFDIKHTFLRIKFLKVVTNANVGCMVAKQAPPSCRGQSPQADRSAVTQKHLL